MHEKGAQDADAQRNRRDGMGNKAKVLESLMRRIVKMALISFACAGQALILFFQKSAFDAPRIGLTVVFYISVALAGFALFLMSMAIIARHRLRKDSDQSPDSLPEAVSIEEGDG